MAPQRAVPFFVVCAYLADRFLCTGKRPLKSARFQVDVTNCNV